MRNVSRKGEIPTDQNANTPEIRIENRVFIPRCFAILNLSKRKMSLPVFPRDSTLTIDQYSGVVCLSAV